jgi:hypothetical protein
MVNRSWQTGACLVLFCGRRGAAIRIRAEVVNLLPYCA